MVSSSSPGPKSLKQTPTPSLLSLFSETSRHIFQDKPHKCGHFISLAKTKGHVWGLLKSDSSYLTFCSLQNIAYLECAMKSGQLSSLTYGLEDNLGLFYPGSVSSQEDTGSFYDFVSISSRLEYFLKALLIMKRKIRLSQLV